MKSAFRAERRKLLAQPATRVLVIVCALGPLLFAGVLSAQSGVPGDTLLGIWAHDSGYALSLVVLGFAGYLGFPLLAGALAGDAFSSEDRFGTWKTLLVRSRSRRELFAGKLLAAWALALVLLALAAASSLAGGLLFSGAHGLVGLSGQSISPGSAFWLVLAAWALSALPLLAFVTLALLCSVASKNGIVGVLGPVLAALAMQLLLLTGNGSWMHALLLASSFDVWHGLFAAPRFWAPLAVALAVALLWTVLCGFAAWRLVRRREFAGQPVAGRRGWLAPARTLAAVAIAIVLLGLGGGAGPTAVTRARLEASLAPAFVRLTLLQQQELGHATPSKARLGVRTVCRRRSGHGQGPGDDWACTIFVVESRQGTGGEPFQLRPVTYDVSVKSNGCWKAEAPPLFVGEQTMRDAHGHNVVNPLFTMYGCFDTTGRAQSGRANGRSTGGSASGRSKGSEAAGSGGASPQSGLERETEETERSIERSGTVPSR